MAGDPSTFKAAVWAESPEVVVHAGLARDQLSLWYCKGYEHDGPRAIYFRPYLRIENERFLSESQRTKAESDEHWAKHRIAIFVDAPTPPGVNDRALAGALLRHELEHVRQHVANNAETFDIDGVFLGGAMSLHAGALPSSNAYYNFKPMELDAPSRHRALARVQRADPLLQVLGHRPQRSAAVGALHCRLPRRAKHLLQGELADAAAVVAHRGGTSPCAPPTAPTSASITTGAPATRSPPTTTANGPSVAASLLSNYAPAPRC